ncbi:MAG: hypothetical protein GC192_20750 [Bacteroidetes bacterium]|nr:hypothetical protein [Bacteroidota bacterium]
METDNDTLTAAFYHFWYTYAARKNGPQTIQDILPLFDKSATTIGTGEHELATNLNEIIKNFGDDFNEFTTPIKIDFFGTKSTWLSPSAGLVEAQGNFELEVEGGGTLNFYLRFTTVFVYKDGKWLLAHNHISFPSQEQDVGKAFPIDALVAKNNHLEKLVTERTLELEEKTEQLREEQDKTEKLLYNILPEEIAQELREKGKADAQHFNMASIMFTDFKGFTQASEKMSAQELVSEINTCFEAFDGICDKYGVEKIKTIGDAYMVAGGLPIPSEESTKNTVLAALDMQRFMVDRNAKRAAEGKTSFEMRAGIHTGPVVAGIVGVKKFQYDVWGDTVNTASRMESAGEVGKVNISQKTYELLKNDPDFVFVNRGKEKVKGKDEKIAMYFVGRI